MQLIIIDKSLHYIWPMIRHTNTNAAKKIALMAEYLLNDIK